MTTITLPWPSRALSPNGRAHWRKLWHAKKLAKDLAWAHTMATNAKAPKDDSPIHLALTFYPKTRNRPDADNLIASCKAYLDGVALALGCDDGRFRLAAPVIAEPVKGGRVEVVLSRCRVSPIFRPWSPRITGFRCSTCGAIVAHGQFLDRAKSRWPWQWR